MARSTVPVMRKPFVVDELIRVFSHHRPVAGAVDAPATLCATA
jgi:hypothetical protein